MIQETEHVRHEPAVVQVTLEYIQNIVGDELQTVDLIVGHQLSEMGKEGHAGTFHLVKKKKSTQFQLELTIKEMKTAANTKLSVRLPMLDTMPAMTDFL